MASTSKAPDLTQQVTRAVAWNTILAPLKVVAELVENLIKLNVLSPPAVGLLTLVRASAASAGIWTDLGIDRSLPRFIPELEQVGGRTAVARFMALVFAGKALLVGLFSAIFLLLASDYVTALERRALELDPRRFGPDDVAAIQGTIATLSPWLVATVLLLVALGSFYDGLMAYLISYFRQRAWNLIGLVGNLLQPLLTAALVLAGWGVAGVLVAMVVTPLVSTALAAWQVGGILDFRFWILDGDAATQSKIQNLKSKIPWSRFFTYTTISNLLNLSDYLISSLFAIFLLNDLAQGALYGVGTALVRQVLALLYAPLAGVQVPLITRVRGGDGSLQAAYAGIGRVLALVLLPGGVGLVLLAHDLILVQYPQFVEAALVVYLLTPCLFAESFLSTAQITLQVYERYRLLLLTRLAALAALPVLLWAAPRYGLVGAALAVGGGRLLMGLAAGLLARRTFDVRHSWRFIGRVALATLAMAAVVWGLLGTLGSVDLQADIGARALGALLLLAVAAAGALTFAVALRLLGGLLPEDRQRIAQSRLPLRRWLLKIL